MVAPSSPGDAYGLMRSAIEDDDPVIFTETLPLYWTQGEIDFKPAPLGKARIGREGSDVTIISYAIGAEIAAVIHQEL